MCRPRTEQKDVSISSAMDAAIKNGNICVQLIGSRVEEIYIEDGGFNNPKTRRESC